MSTELTAEQLELNQKFIDLVNEYFDDPENAENYEEGYWVDGKALMKFFWNKGYKIVAR